MAVGHRLDGGVLFDVLAVRRARHSAALRLGVSRGGVTTVGTGGRRLCSCVMGVRVRLVRRVAAHSAATWRPADEYWSDVMKHAVALTVNGEACEGEIEPRTLLVHFLRDHLGLTGTHVGCVVGECGACSVLVEGALVKSCLMLA